jgi:hypothetical protein
VKSDFVGGFLNRGMETDTAVQEKYHSLKAHLDERARRIWAATEARAIGYGHPFPPHNFVSWVFT